MIQFSHCLLALFSYLCSLLYSHSISFFTTTPPSLSLLGFRSSFALTPYIYIFANLNLSIEFEELIEIPNEYRHIGPYGSIIPPEIIDFQDGIFTLSIPRISLSGWHQEEADTRRREREEKVKREEDARKVQQSELDSGLVLAMEKAHKVWIDYWMKLHTLFNNQNELDIRALIQQATVNDLMEMFPVLIQLVPEKHDPLKTAIVEEMLKKRQHGTDFIVDLWAHALVPQQNSISQTVKHSVDWVRKIASDGESSGPIDKVIFTQSTKTVQLQNPIIVPGCGAQSSFITRSYQCEKVFRTATEPKLIVFFSPNNPPESNRLIYKPGTLTMNK